MTKAEILTSLPPVVTQRNLGRVTLPIQEHISERQPRYQTILADDVEGPFFLGDFIAEAMANCVKPKGGGIDAIPSYGQIIYQTGWEWFTSETLEHRKPLKKNNASGKPVPHNRFTLGQEGTDTIFTLPLLIASGVNYNYLEELTRKSKQTPGSDILVKSLERDGVLVVGVTTAPQEPYRALVEERKFLDKNRIIGSPFPIDETRDYLLQTGLWEEEISMVQRYLEDCYCIIDEESAIDRSNGALSRSLSEQGKQRLFERVKRFHDEELGITFDPDLRKTESRPTTGIGQIIERVGMVGDRAKAAVARHIYFRNGNPQATLLAMGDGANDAYMLQSAHISIGLNGADAAKAAKIGVVTDNVVNVLPVFHQVLRGERNIDLIISRAQNEVGNTAIIHHGGRDIDSGILAEHKRIKLYLRGQNITY